MESAAQVRSIELAIEQLIDFLKIYYIDAAPCSSHSAINEMKKREAYSKGVLTKTETSYLKKAGQNRTVAKRHNSTN